MGQHTSRHDFEWTYTDQPHVARRQLMLKKYPQIKKLFGVDPNFKWACSAVVIVNIMAAIVLRGASWPVYIFFSVVFGSTLHHMLTLATHEISHNVVFGNSYPLANRFFGIWANLPMIIPMSIGFKKYHVDHHRYLSTDFDVDIPTHTEAKIFSNTFMKFVWLFVQPILYGARPNLVKPKPLLPMEIVNIVIQMTFNVALIKIFGMEPFLYLLLTALFSMGIHPVAGHFISEHYMFYKGYETYSYYGALNALTWNVGYHVEHHDFPFIPGSRLPLLAEIAPEFYKNIPCHTSWLKVLYDFVMDPKMGPYARIKHPVGCKVPPTINGVNTQETLEAVGKIWRLDDWQKTPDVTSLPGSMTTLEHVWKRTKSERDMNGNCKNGKVVDPGSNTENLGGYGSGFDLGRYWLNKLVLRRA